MFVVCCLCVQCFCLPFSERGVQGVAGRSQGGTCGTEEEEERSKSIRQQLIVRQNKSITTAITALFELLTNVTRLFWQANASKPQSAIASTYVCV